MLKNKTETKQILNEWRKVLNEGLYDHDPELLEEGFKEIAMAATLGLGTLLGFGEAKAAPTQENMAKIMQQAGVAASQTPEKSFKMLLNGCVSYLESNGASKVPHELKELIAKLADKKIHDLKPKEISKAAIILKKSSKMWKTLLEEAERAIKDWKAAENDPGTPKDTLSALRDKGEAALSACKTYGDLFKLIDAEFQSIEGFNIEGLGVPWRKLIKISLDGKEIFGSSVEGFK